MRNFPFHSKLFNSLCIIENMSNSIREIGENIKNYRFFEGSVSFDEPMNLHTTMKVGGKAALFIEPADTYSAATAFSLCKAAGISVFTLGGGSNLVVSDDGFDGAVISSRKINRIDRSFVQEDVAAYIAQNTTLQTVAGSVSNNVSSVTGAQATSANVAQSASASGALSSNIPFPQVSGCKPAVVELWCGAGTRMNDISDYCAKYGIIGLDHFAGLPGTAGGEVYMNARCYEQNIGDVISAVEYIDLSELYGGKGPVSSRTYAMNGKDWSYKHSPFQDMHAFVTRVQFKCLCLDSRIFDGYSAADPAIQAFVQANNDHYVQDRVTKGHFRAPSAGSVFKNNHDFGKPSGKLVDEAGLKGTAIGGAQIAPWHGNFIINTGKATAADIHALVELAQQKVKKETGFMLEPEIIFCGKGYENHV